MKKFIIKGNKLYQITKSRDADKTVNKSGAISEVNAWNGKNKLVLKNSSSTTKVTIENYNNKYKIMLNNKSSNSSRGRTYNQTANDLAQAKKIAVSYINVYWKGGNSTRILGYVVEIKGRGWVMSEDALTFSGSSKDAFIFPSEASARQAILAHNDYFYHKGYDKKIYMWKRIEWSGGPKGSFITNGSRGIPIPLIPPRRFDDSFPSREYAGKFN